MCSFIVVNKYISDEELEKANVFSKRRGPDATNIYREIYGITILHNLLHITGEKTIQPFIKGKYACVFNGEIYNYKELGDYKTDGECIIDAFMNYGWGFVNELDGEFSIIIIHIETGTMFAFTDRFATKPLYASYDGSSSYESSLRNINSYGVRKYFNRELFNKFDLKQHKNTYDNWIEAFENAIRKRTQNKQRKYFTGLSSGYDSGAIVCEMTKQDVDFKAYSILGNENPDTLNKRHKIIKNGEIIRLTRKEYEKNKKWLIENCEDFECEIELHGMKNKQYKIKNDKASVGISTICDKARKEGRIIYISGQGADEIISDYGYNGNRFYGNSNFGGLFPDDLNTIFPWNNFYGGTQVAYLNKEEYVAGAHGIEARYPFLDTQVVQEFLWLSPKLKNQFYKSCLREYLKRNDFPYDENIKIGFGANKNLL